MGVQEPVLQETPPPPAEHHDDEQQHHEGEDHHDEDHHHRDEEHDEHEKRRKRPHAPGHEADLTICAPQLLHLDLSGKPLWFNGWLYHNKFAGRAKQGGRFEVYMKEPREVLEPGAWQLEEGNVCCLSNREVFEFSAEEKRRMEMMIGFAREAGSYVDQKD